MLMQKTKCWLNDAIINEWAYIKNCDAPNSSSIIYVTKNTYKFVFSISISQFNISNDIFFL